MPPLAPEPTPETPGALPGEAPLSPEAPEPVFPDVLPSDELPVAPKAVLPPPADAVAPPATPDSAEPGADPEPPVASGTPPAV